MLVRTENARDTPCGVQEGRILKERFKGYYFKHQKDGQTLCVIAGRSENEKFIQILTNDFSGTFPFAKGNFFSSKGIRLNIKTPDLLGRTDPSHTGKILPGYPDKKRAGPWITGPAGWENVQNHPGKSILPGRVPVL